MTARCGAGVALAVLAAVALAACSQQDQHQQSPVSFIEGVNQAPSSLQPQQRLDVRTPDPRPVPSPQAAAPVQHPRYPSYDDPRPQQAQPLPQGVVASVYGRQVQPSAPIVIPPSPALTPPSSVVVQSHLSMLNPDPRCEPFRAQMNAVGAGGGALDANVIARFAQILQAADASGCVRQS